jgi:integrating conjugative element protein (TIGR03752 family)
MAGLIILGALFIGMKSCTQQKPAKLTLTAVPVAPQPDADSPADTVRTLTAHVAELKTKAATIERQNSELLSQKNDIAASLKTTLNDELNKRKNSLNPELNVLTEQVETLKSKLDQVAQSATSSSSTSITPNDNAGLSTTATETVVWIEPLGKLPSTAESFSSPLNNSVLHPESTGLSPHSGDHSASVAEPPEPRFTVPRNATLIGSTAMTALIGKVPFKDTLSDPFPFKVIVGRDNLAANGIDIPGLDGMVFSGHTSGDWTLGCVRGNVNSVTFVFDDGTIRTLSGNAQGTASNTQSPAANNMLNDPNTHASQNLNNAIGWISDKRGIPCVSGQRISNAATFLSGRILARAAQSASKAFAQSNITQSVTPLGGVISGITGNAAEYAGLNALAGGADEISDYLKERAAQSFDVVYVDTGVELAIHIDRELPIDYEPKGRKTTYELVENTATSALD